MVSSSGKALDVIGTLARLGLAAVWLVSGAVKVSDLNQTYVAVSAYEVLPSGLVSPVATGLPFLELALGVLVLAGFGTRIVAALSIVVLLAFIGGLIQAWARGLSIDCGCFGSGGKVAAGDTQYPLDLARDVGFLALAGWLLVRPRTLFAADSLLEARDSEPAEPGNVPGSTT